MTDATPLRPAPAPAATGTYWDVDEVVAGLHAARGRWRAAHPRNAEHGANGFPSRREVERIMAELCGLLFPLRLGPSFLNADNEDAFVGQALEGVVAKLYGQIRRELGYAPPGGEPARIDDEAARIIGAFAAALPALREAVDRDVEAAFAADPAARSVDEVLICYPSALAILHHRLAHLLHGLGAPLVARLISEVAHTATGIDIHPAAEIGHSFFIDHGTGVVIGETAVIGDRVRLHQAVTLGAPIAAEADARRGQPRHPVIGDDVVIHAGAILLGRIRVGDGATIGGNVWLTDDVPAGARVTQAPARIDG